MVGFLIATAIVLTLKFGYPLIKEFISMWI